MIENLHFVKDLGLQSQRALESGNLAEFARLMDVHWQRKKQRSGGMSNPKINEWYDLAMASGALGGKLIGAGGGGFLMFYAGDKTKLRQAMARPGLRKSASGSILKERNSSSHKYRAGKNDPQTRPRRLGGGFVFLHGNRGVGGNDGHGFALRLCRQSAGR